MRTLKITTLNPAKDGWVDRDMLMLHACFQILVDFVEKEDGLNQWGNNEVVSELKHLYNWWKKDLHYNIFEYKEAQAHLIRLINVREFLWS